MEMIDAMELRIPHKAWILVCDARKALFLRNEGDAAYPNLQLERATRASANPSTANQGTDRPGRIQNAFGPTSAAEATDWHEVAEAQFARETVDAFRTLYRSRPHGVVLVAPPKMLAALRENLHDDLHATVIAEIDKDLTKHPIQEIERLLTGV